VIGKVELTEEVAEILEEIWPDASRAIDRIYAEMFGEDADA
jgi:hypothetical protein